MAGLARGLDEMLVTEALEGELGALEGSGLSAERGELQRAEAADRIALHLGRTIERALGALPEKERVRVATALAREVVELVVRSTDAAGLAGERPVEPGGVLRSVRALLPDGRAEPLAEPLIPLLDTTLLTNAPGEPRIGSQIEAEIQSADRIDVVMAFIRRSGIRPLLEALRRHCMTGSGLRTCRRTRRTGRAAMRWRGTSSTCSLEGGVTTGASRARSASTYRPVQ